MKSEGCIKKASVLKSKEYKRLLAYINELSEQIWKLQQESDNHSIITAKHQRALLRLTDDDKRADATIVPKKKVRHKKKYK